jgi:hypothetical protein
MSNVAVPPKPQAAMERGTDAMRLHMSEATTKMEVRQTRRGWLQECFGCEAKNEFKYFIGGNQIAHSLEDSSCPARMFCTPCYHWTMQVKELNTNTEIVTIDRPCAWPVGTCKCCCYQTATFASGGHNLGKVKETCYFCVPSFKMYDDQDRHLYTIHPPTCCCGVCPNCCTEGCPCTPRGCCKFPFWIFAPDQANTNGGDAPHVGKILKKPKSLMTEVFTEANAFDVDFPADATASQKAMLVGTSVFFNSIFFESQQEG